MTTSPIIRTYPVPFLNYNNTGGAQPVVAIFDIVPPGYIWTGSISATIAQNITPGTQSQIPAGYNPFNDILQNMEFTLYRNTVPEWTWVGLSALCNIQLMPNDAIIVVGVLPQSGTSYVPQTGITFDAAVNLSLNVNITFTGYSTDQGSAVLTVPFISTSVQSTPSLSTAFPVSALQTATIVDTTLVGTQPLLASVPHPGILENARLWGTWLTVANAAVANCTVTAQIVDSAVTPRVLNTVVSAAVGTTGTAMGGHLYVPLPGGMFMTGIDFPLNLTVVTTGTDDVFRVSAGVQYSVEQLAFT